MFTLNNMGFDICHRGDFSIDRPSGSGDWLIIIFKTQSKGLFFGNPALLGKSCKHGL